MNTAHTSSKHIGIVWRASAATAAIIIVLLMTGNDSPASDTPTTTTASAPTTTTSKPATTSVPPKPDKTKLKEVPPYDPSNLMWQMLAAIVVILILGTLAYVVVKKVLPKIGQTTGKRISLLETVYLQPKQALHLIQVGSRKLLIASSPEGLVRLDDVTDAIGPDYAETAQRIEDAEKASENKQDVAK